MLSSLLNIWVCVLAVALAVLVARIVWFWAKGELSQPAEWSSTERWLGRFAAWCFAAGSLVSGLAAGYVAMRVPWADDLPALLSYPPKVVTGKEPMPVSTAAYLFLLPLGLAVMAAALTDPWAIRQIKFRGPREFSLCALPAIGLILSAYSLWKSIAALSAHQ